MALLAILSVILIVLDYAKVVNLAAAPYNWVDSTILGIFAVDYFSRLLISHHKWSFVKNNVFDLLSIIPVSNVFGLFRIVRLGRLLRLLRLLRVLRLVGLVGRIELFFKMNSLLYYLYLSIAILIITFSMYCISEKVSFNTALWWSITTSTTVGYGDVSPVTGLGKIAAVIDMLVGIGMVGMLTSSITNLFTVTSEDQTTRQLKKLERENQQLMTKMNEIEQLLQKKAQPTDWQR